MTPIVPALEKIWADARGSGLADFNFKTVTSRFNELVYQYPIRIPERYSLVIRWVCLACFLCVVLHVGKRVSCVRQHVCVWTRPYRQNDVHDQFSLRFHLPSPLPAHAPARRHCYPAPGRC